jgi:hypothetical protein
LRKVSGDEKKHELFAKNVATAMLELGFTGADID